VKNATKIEKLKARFPSTNKKRKQAEETIVSRALATHIAENVLSRTPDGAANWLARSIVPAIPLDSEWHNALRRLVNALRSADCSGVFNLHGNVKLPDFAAFSTLPGFTCPGAGACLDFCYSYKAWRYPGAFVRQVLATVAMRNWAPSVAEQFRALPIGIHVRLYVDGDFDSVSTLRFWLDLVRERADLRVYGYSKSWDLFVSLDDSGYRFPSNYVLNLSSGSIHENALRDRISAIVKENGKRLVRGQFVAVGIDGKLDNGARIPRGAERYNSAEYHERVRDSALVAYGQRAFSCPGHCDSCGKGKHVCGNENANVLIAIGIH